MHVPTFAADVMSIRCTCVSLRPQLRTSIFGITVLCLPNATIQSNAQPGPACCDTRLWRKLSRRLWQPHCQRCGCALACTLMMSSSAIGQPGQASRFPWERIKIVHGRGLAHWAVFLWLATAACACNAPIPRAVDVSLQVCLQRQQLLHLQLHRHLPYLSALALQLQPHRPVKPLQLPPASAQLPSQVPAVPQRPVRRLQPQQMRQLPSNLLLSCRCGCKLVFTLHEALVPCLPSC